MIFLPKNFIGVMDSGVGGLSVLKILRENCPQCNFVYVADHAFCPYGTKSLREINCRVLKIATFLKNSGATALVLACNTASIFASQLRKTLRLPVFDCIYPTCAQTLAATKTRKTALLATNATVQSGKYQRALQKLGILVVPLGCSCFVPLVENNAPETLRRSRVFHTLLPLKNIEFDTVILGCTHFPFLAKEISTVLPEKKIVSSSFAVASCFAKSRLALQGQGVTLCFTTGNPSEVNSVSKLGYTFSGVDI